LCNCVIFKVDSCRLAVDDDTHICKQNEVLEAGVKMSLLLKADNLLEMRVICVGIYTKQALEYGLYYFLEVWWEWCAWGKGNKSISCCA
jgi:hypothetical protein